MIPEQLSPKAIDHLTNIFKETWELTDLHGATNRSKAGITAVLRTIGIEVYE